MTLKHPPRREAAGKRLHFPGLNGLRFVAAGIVVICHIEEEKANAGLANHFSNPVIAHMGGLAVTLFFVLSGFLISYLLFAEQDSSGTIGIKNFYLRRVLRIWPLYYLVAFVGFFIFAQLFGAGHRLPSHAPHPGPELLLFALVMPNVARVLIGVHPFLSNLWSVGVEEQFYLIWPMTIKHAKRWRLPVLLFLVGGMYCLRRLLSHFGGVNSSFPSGSSLRIAAAYASSFFWFFRIDCMAIGAIGAHFLHRGDSRILKPVFHKFTQLLVYALLGFFFLTGSELPFGNDPVYSLFFIAIILNVSANPGTLLSLENPVLDYLGKISYGLYMYHVMTIMIVLKTLVRLLPADSALFDLCAYSLTFALAVGVAGCSYALFERPFLNLKERFSPDVRRDDAPAAAPSRPPSLALTAGQ
jgi:peptidoglycan/LPS O-acetylase OafA/YrhL